MVALPTQRQSAECREPAQECVGHRVAGQETVEALPATEHRVLEQSEITQQWMLGLLRQQRTERLEAGRISTAGHQQREEADAVIALLCEAVIPGLQRMIGILVAEVGREQLERGLFVEVGDTAI